jgi:hypothetical protein
MSDTTFNGSVTIGASIDAVQPVLIIAGDPQTQGGEDVVAFELNIGDSVASLTLGGKWTATKYVGRAGSSNIEGAAPVQCWSQHTTVGNVGTGEDTLFSVTIADTLKTNGDRLEFYALIHVSGMGNDKTARVKFGGTTFLSRVDQDSTDKHIELHGFITRTGSGTVKAWGTVEGQDINATPDATQYSTYSVTLSSAQTFAITGEATNTNDVELLDFFMRYLPH